MWYIFIVTHLRGSIRGRAKVNIEMGGVYQQASSFTNIVGLWYD
ncbi:hypothetical protein [Neobacillus cucumis]|nr:hypothetical protein [Neobacillus cucumis]